MLSWDKEVLTFAPHDTNGQPEWQRKERLYHEVSFFFLIFFFKSNNKKSFSKFR